jgi:acyl carrier protein
MTEANDPRKKIINLLALHLGVEPEDINDEDSLREDLHMNPIDLADFTQTLEENYDTSKLDLANIETVEDLTDALSLHTDI